MLDRLACKAGAGLRVSEDNLPQEGGKIIHRELREGYAMHLAVQLWDGSGVKKPACGATRRQMFDELAKFTNALTDVSQADLDAGLARIRWTPSGLSGAR